jgi:hypothetical protein
MNLNKIKKDIGDWIYVEIKVPTIIFFNFYPTTSKWFRELSHGTQVLGSVKNRDWFKKYFYGGYRGEFINENGEMTILLILKMRNIDDLNRIQKSFRVRIKKLLKLSTISIYIDPLSECGYKDFPSIIERHKNILQPIGDVYSKTIEGIL